jgi:hypothetical protein
MTLKNKQLSESISRFTMTHKRKKLASNRIMESEKDHLSL